jgi:Na+-translocating ferredoxin:NAD+ oxidoreductase subunit E
VVNCIVLGRAEAFASKNGLVRSAADGTGIGLGFTCALASLGAVRELLGTGSLEGDVFGHLHYSIPHIFGASFEPFGFAVQAPGAFIALGLMLCLMNLIPSK